MKTELIKMFEDSSVEGKTIKPPAEKVDPKLYADYKKALTDNLGKWKGGKAQHFVFEFDPNPLLKELRAGNRPSFKQEWHYFPTPPEVIDFMCNAVIPSHDNKILEPSAGRGSIIEEVNAFMPNCEFHWTVIEPHPVNRKILEDKGIQCDWDDFDTYKPKADHDLIYANPPFKHARSHVAKMPDCLNRGGCMTVVLPNTFESKESALVAELRGRFESVCFYSLPERSFKTSGTMVNTVIMVASFKG